MKKQIYGFILAFITAGFFLTSCQKANQPLGDSPELKKAPLDWSNASYPLPTPTNTAGDMITVPLYAGKTTLVGEVTVDQVGGYLLIRYNVLDDCVTLVSTHLSVTATYAQIPLSNGNPPPGQFNYNNWPGEFDGNDWVFEPIPIPSGIATSGDYMNKVFIAAHAVVTGPCVGNCEADLDAFIDLIPTTIASAHFEGNNLFPESYFKITITDGAALNGSDYEGWCVDLDHNLYPPVDSKVKFVSTYDPNFASLVSALIDMPANIKAVNWILNQDFVGKPSPCGGGNYTYGDVQTAIWKLLENTFEESQGGALAVRYNCIYNAALNHLDFVPGCGQLVGIVLIPVDDQGVYNGKQPTLISIPMPCDCDEETAWAIGPAFPGNNWAMYFNYLILPPQ